MHQYDDVCILRYFIYILMKIIWKPGLIIHVCLLIPVRVIGSWPLRTWYHVSEVDLEFNTDVVALKSGLHSYCGLPASLWGLIGPFRAN